MKLIKLTDRWNKPVYIDPTEIVAIDVHDFSGSSEPANVRTRICLRGGVMTCQVSELPGTVYNLIMEAK